MAFDLSEVFAEYGTPDPATVSYLDKNGVSLAYVGHAEITKALSDIDPGWTWEPVLGADGLPAIRVQHGQIPRRDKEPLHVDMATMWGRLTLCGVTRWAVGSVEAHKPDLDKELVSDFLRNAAMRFGVALTLWMKPTSPASTSRAFSPSTSTENGPRLATEAQRKMIYAVCKSIGRTIPDGLDKFTSVQASRLIDELKEQQMKRDEAPEEVF